MSMRPYPLTITAPPSRKSAAGQEYARRFVMTRSIRNITAFEHRTRSFIRMVASTVKEAGP